MDILSSDLMNQLVEIIIQMDDIILQQVKKKQYGFFTKANNLSKIIKTY